MTVQHYKTENRTLKKYIDGYYFMTKGDTKLPIRYLTFPTNFPIISTSQDSDVKFENEKIVVTPSKKIRIVTDLVIKYTKPFEVFYQEPVNEITIKFKPLGLNRFVANLSDYFTNGFYMDFQPFDDLNMEMQSIFNIAERHEQIERLENYWLSKLKDVELSRLEKIVYDLESEYSIAEISKKNNISKQYLNKIFFKNLGKTPSEYRKVHKFRKALMDFKNVNNLTELSYESLFYDQSHFIKEFKSLTDIKPSQFFKNIGTNKEVAWLFL
ncbi:helix-turn-helix domain-containing protein [Gillisia limnaea]|uniref:Helix-turn-helix domain-containing protein AraC type n=1 Tax=Gillisia limnaea (strain DSM 15749 / LMG 21470 / R-8282) TaxID=865937 RepID=H2BXE9_GILLR|nr:helix-turn-helix domain-containing protein [Gillisia limnaea]EHQ02031.1 helix-turn-helix domain-containing protein AraC type [Gillisia limnaea DSM 15749]